MMIETTLITGGTGFIGHWLSSSFRERKKLVFVLDSLQYQYGDWENYNWSNIIHLAPTDPGRVIECAKRCKARVLYTSSGAVYDKQPGEYALGKLHGERMLLDSGLDIRIVRMFSFCGGYMRNHFAVINYIIDAISGDQIKIRGDNVTRSYMYAFDMANWLYKILYDGRKNQIYTVGSEYAVTMQTLAEQVNQCFGGKKRIVEDRIYGPDARPYYVPDTRVTREELGLFQTVDFESAIRKTVKWYVDYLSLIQQEDNETFRCRCSLQRK
jgi:nucleoside-diphosphate-sugar epimerase